MHWPAPVVRTELEAERGPVMVTIEYRIDPATSLDFEHAMERVEEIKRRDGATFWTLMVDAVHPARYVEFFMVESWLEHLRQHERITVADRAIEDAAHAFHVGGKRPAVTHFVASQIVSHTRHAAEDLRPVLRGTVQHEP
jgi:hypothetical protein